MPLLTSFTANSFAVYPHVDGCIQCAYVQATAIPTFNLSLVESA